MHKIFPQPRKKAQWVEEGEKCIKYFLNLEKKKREDTTIRKLEKQKGGYAITTSEILSEKGSFYRELYTTEQVDISTQN